ncbi:MAG TPA: formyltetrahydrofolate deformylase [Verrucomicrobiae bacterium]|jgi:formyltetrahydrofolate deformylase
MKEFAILTVIGRDKTGVIARITNFLFEHRANIEALEEQVTRGQFSMTLQASWTGSMADKGRMTTGLSQLAMDLGMEIKLRWTDPRRRQRMAVMVTGEPHCGLALLEAVRSGRIKADPCVMISNRRELSPLAKEFGIPFTFIPWNDRAAAEKRALRCLEEYEADFVALARFMKILSPNFVWRYKNKIINIHPSLLPSFPGPQAYRQAYEYGVKIIGVTSHFVSMRLDEGPIIAQASAAIPANATLKQIIATGQRLESAVLVKAIRLYLTKRLDVYWGVVKEV